MPDSIGDSSNLYDPRGLIREAYRIDGIGAEDCRSIFLDWALGLSDDIAASTAVRALLAHYRDEPPDHPMTKVLKDSLKSVEKPRRRGGASGRRN